MGINSKIREEKIRKPDFFVFLLFVTLGTERKITGVSFQHSLSNLCLFLLLAGFEKFNIITFKKEKTGVSLLLDARNSVFRALDIEYLFILVAVSIQEIQDYTIQENQQK